LKETEKILLEMEVSRNVSLREVFEAKNLARVAEFIRAKDSHEFCADFVLLLHRMLMINIDDSIAGRFREKGEYVRVGTHIAPPPEKVEGMIGTIFGDYLSDIETYFVDKIAKFHLDFEKIHPFNDGNGRMGRVILNFQLIELGLPSVIIRDKEKKTYYQAFRDYDGGNFKTMEKVVALALMESLHKRIAYLKGNTIITLADFVRKNKLSAPAVLNAAKRQNVPAFRENGVWKIGE